MTLLLRRWCEEQVESSKSNWLRGAFATQQESDRAIGNATAFGEILEIDIEQLNGVLEND